MKKLVLVVACTLCMLSVSAQSEKSEGVTWGIRAGLNVANQHDASIDGGGNGGTRLGFNVGVIADIPIVSGQFYFQPGLYFTTKGFKYTESDGGKSWKEEYIWKTTPSYIEIPLLLSARYAICDKIVAQVNFGPYFAVGVTGKYKHIYKYSDNGGSQSDSDDWDYFGEDDGVCGKRFDCGVSLGGGVTFVKHIYLGFQYEFGFTNAYKEMGIKNRNCMISLGYNF
ncbi:MAG: PorT family protein [Prevotella sp.]|nr:PorT family protein [Prevotella sp.]